jgi:hypothetical protein
MREEGQTHGHDYEGATTGEEFEAVHHLDKTKTQRILQALFLGMEVTMGGYTWRLFEHNDGGFCPGVVNGDKLICGMPDLPFVGFTNMCEKMSDEDFQSLEANYFFNMMRRK